MPSSHVIVTFIYSLTYFLFSRDDNIWKDDAQILGRLCNSTNSKIEASSFDTRGKCKKRKLFFTSFGFLITY